MKKSCKLLSLILVMCLMLAMFAGCTTGGGDTPPPTNHTEATSPSGNDPTVGTEPVDVTEATDPTVDGEVTVPTDSGTPTDPTQGEVPTDPTDPTGDADVSGTDATEENGVTDPTTDAPSEAPTDPSEAPTEEPTEGDEPTDPTVAPTEKPTEASTEAPTEAPHVHSYTKKVVAATCEKKGYTKYTCSCGESNKDNYKDATGHDYDKEFISQTCTEEGYVLHTCKSCGDSYKDGYSPAEGHDYFLIDTKPATYNSEGVLTYECTFCGAITYKYFSLSEEELEEVYRDVEAAVVKYINQFRVEQGDTEMDYLPGMSQVAQMRAEQLKTKWGHDTMLLREAHAHYQYGLYHDMTKHGLDASNNYWGSNCKEAIALNGQISGSATADEVGYAIASQFRNSPNHWSYLGGADYHFIGVGIARRGGNWYCCTLQPDANYG